MKLTLSKKAIEALIINFEVSSKRNYDRRLQRPIWPGGASGVTIGLGYDLGHQKPDDVRRDLDGLLTPEQIIALITACGVTGPRARTICNNLQHIVLLWDKACVLFYKSSLPFYAKQTYRVYPDVVNIHPYEQTVFVGLVYNRGNALRDSSANDRRREMRELIAAIKADNDKLMASLLRSMKRLWNDSQKGLILRREEEAKWVELADTPIPEDDKLEIDV